MSELKLKIIGSSLIAVAIALLISFGIVLFLNQSNNASSNDESNNDQDIYVQNDQDDYIKDNVENNNSSSESSLEPINAFGPSAWLCADDSGISAGTRVELVSCPGIDVQLRSGGVVISELSDASKRDGYDSYIELVNEATVMRGDDSEKAVVKVDSVGLVLVQMENLLVNLPDILPDASYDAVYSYSAPSDCAGNEIPGLTGCRVDGYRDGETYDSYLGREQYVMQIYYSTAIKTISMEQTVEESGYKLLFWDTYRPWRGSKFISDKFTLAYNSSEAIRNGTGGWGLSWYAASSSSGHNFGTDIDVSLVYAASMEPVIMPSHFDSFDPSAHLTVKQEESSSITNSDYKESVRENKACITLHEAALQNGFSELASEWWHFGDKSGETSARSVVGNAGLDFVADLL